MKRGKYLEYVLDIIDEDLKQMGCEDDYEIYGSTRTNVDDESVIVLIDFPHSHTQAFEFPYEKKQDKEEVEAAYLDSPVRRHIREAIEADAYRRQVTVGELPADHIEEDYDEEDYMENDYEEFSYEDPF